MSIFNRARSALNQLNQAQPTFVSRLQRRIQQQQNQPSGLNQSMAAMAQPPLQQSPAPMTQSQLQALTQLAAQAQPQIPASFPQGVPDTGTALGTIAANPQGFPQYANPQGFQQYMAEMRQREPQMLGSTMLSNVPNTGTALGGLDSRAIAANPQGFQQYMAEMRQREAQIPGSTMLSNAPGGALSPQMSPFAQAGYEAQMAGPNPYAQGLGSSSSPFVQSQLYAQLQSQMQQPGMPSGMLGGGIGGLSTALNQPMSMGNTVQNQMSMLQNFNGGQQSAFGGGLQGAFGGGQQSAFGGGPMQQAQGPTGQQSAFGGGLQGAFGSPQQSPFGGGQNITGGITDAIKYSRDQQSPPTFGGQQSQGPTGQQSAFGGGLQGAFGGGQQAPRQGLF
jgi:hypothetical protein